MAWCPSSEKKKQFKPPTLNVLNVSSWQIIQNYSIIKTFSLPAEASVGRLRRLRWLIATVGLFDCCCWISSLLSDSAYAQMSSVLKRVEKNIEESHQQPGCRTGGKKIKKTSLHIRKPFIYPDFLHWERQDINFPTVPSFIFHQPWCLQDSEKMFTSKKYLKNIHESDTPWTPSSRGFLVFFYSLRIGSDPGIRSVEYFPQI